MHRWILSSFLFGSSLWGQTAEFTFSFRNPASTTATVVSGGGTVVLAPTPVGASVTGRFVISNRTEFSWTLADAAVTGAGFSGGARDLPISGGSSVTFDIRFAPDQKRIFDGTLTLDLNSGTRRVSVLVFLSGTGIGPEFIFSYAVNPGGNRTAVANGDTMMFAPTPINGAGTITVHVLNKGNGPGVLNRVVATGEGFRLSGAPLLPAEIGPEKEIQFNIIFSPSGRNRSTGSLQMQAGSNNLAFTLEGPGIGPAFQYEVTLGSRVVRVEPAGRILIPDTPLNTPIHIFVRVHNTGNADGRIASVSATGEAFQVADLPALPVALPPEASFAFTLRFLPKASGPASGLLRIDVVNIELSGTGIGPNLTFLALAGPSSTPLSNNGTLNFPNTAVGEHNSAIVQISNQGNAPTRVNNAAIAGEAFALTQIPRLPADLAPGQSVEMTVRFVPSILGASTAVLQVDDFRVNLRGTGTQPPALPEPTLSAPGSAQPLEQPAVRVALTDTYPHDVNGKLTISFGPESFVDDPAIQFSTGGRSVDFRIPANTREALFPDGGSTIQLQSGTVAGIITLTASFATAGVTLTPSPPPSKNVAVSASAPKVRAVQVSNTTETGFDLIVSGYSTTRTLEQMVLDFTAAPGHSLRDSRLTVDVDSAFRAWYQSQNSRAFGSQFSAVLRIQASGDLNAVQSVSVVAASSRGSSDPVVVNVR